MSDYEAITVILNETVVALSDLDLTKLRLLEQQMSEYAQMRVEAEREGMSAIMYQKACLQIVLHNCKANLNTLHRLHERKVRNSWAR